MLNLYELNDYSTEKVQSWILKKGDNKLINYDKQYLEQIKIWLKKKETNPSYSYCVLCRIISAKKVQQMGIIDNKKERREMVNNGKLENDIIVFPVSVKKNKFSFFRKKKTHLLKIEEYDES
jgi:hypothetical protein